MCPLIPTGSFANRPAPQCLGQCYFAEDLDIFYIVTISGTTLAWTAVNPAAGAVGNLQANNGGMLAGVPGSSVDFTNGMTTFAPIGTGVALTIKGDAHSNAGLSILPNSGLTAGGHIEGVIEPNGGALNVYGKNPSGVAQILAEGFTAAGGTNEFLVSATQSHVLVNVTSASGGSIDESCSSVTELTLADASGASIDMQPALGIMPPQFTVAALPAGSEGYIAWATNGCKPGEAAGAGTGVPVCFSKGQWYALTLGALTS